MNSVAGRPEFNPFAHPPRRAVPKSIWLARSRNMGRFRRVHETVAPAMPARFEHPAVLVFSKTNGFRHDEAIEASNPMFVALGKQNDWSVFVTENGAVHSPRAAREVQSLSVEQRQRRCAIDCPARRAQGVHREWRRVHCGARGGRRLARSLAVVCAGSDRRQIRRQRPLPLFGAGPHWRILHRTRNAGHKAAQRRQAEQSEEKPDDAPRDPDGEG